MNYKTLIAFLGKNQMKDWATPRSDWVLVKDWKDRQFTDEFLAVKPDVKDTLICKPFVSFESSGLTSFNSSNAGFRFEFKPGHGSYWQYWYSPTKDIYIILTSNVEKSNYQPLLEAMKEWLISLDSEDMGKLFRGRSRHDMSQIGQPLA